MDERLSASASLVAIGVWMGLAAMLIHELGHVFGAMLTGGSIVSLELRPGHLSYTLVRPNPRPSVVLWSGFLFGWVAPFATFPAWKIEQGMIGPVLRAWAAFCLLAGGSYLAIGGGERLTDTGQLATLGWPMFFLVLTGMAVAAVGYWRSRAAWILIAESLRKRGIRSAAALGWWLWLIAWWGGQQALAGWLNP